jgi:hypothetical protein
MRGTLEPMDTITRAEFDDRINRLATKKDLENTNGALEKTSKILENTNKALADLRADMLAGNRRLLAAIAPLPTKTEMQHAIALATAPLATKVEMHETIAAAVAPLATKADISLMATKAEMQETIKAATTPLASKADVTLLATKAEVAQLATRGELQEGFARVQLNHESLKKDVKDLTEFLEAGLTENEARLRDLEAMDLAARNRSAD